MRTSTETFIVQQLNMGTQFPMQAVDTMETYFRRKKLQALEKVDKKEEREPNLTDSQDHSNPFLTSLLVIEQ